MEQKTFASPYEWCKALEKDLDRAYARIAQIEKRLYELEQPMFNEMENNEV